MANDELDDMSSVVPEGWSKVKIGSLISEISEKTICSNQHEVLSVTKDGITPQRGYFNKQIASEDNTGYKILRKGNLVFGTMNLWMGSLDVLKEPSIGIVSPAYKTFRFNTEKCGVDFMSNFMRTPYMVHKYVLHSQQGASIVRRNLNLDQLLVDEVVIPPLPEQKKIASILTSVDEVIENTQQQIDKLQDLKKATMNELLTKGIGHTEFKDSELGRIPKSWYSKRLGDVASIIMGQSPTSDTYNENENGTPFFQGKADFGVKYPKVRYQCTSPTKIAPVDSILFSVRAPVGAVNLNNVEACIGRGLASISGKSIDSTFLYQSLIHAKVKFEALGQGSTFEAINGNELKEFSLACPPLQEQKKIASIITSMDKNIEEKQRKLQQTQSLKKSLMQDLLTGKVRVTMN